jgi:hypothetical protein
VAFVRWTFFGEKDAAFATFFTLFLGREQNAQRIVITIIAGFDFKCNYLDNVSPNLP